MSPRLDPEEEAVALQVGRNLCRCRQEVGMSVEEVARRAELSRTTIHKIERGLRLPQIDTGVRLAGALGVEPDELMKGIAFRKPSSERPAGLYIRGRRQG